MGSRNLNDDPAFTFHSEPKGKFSQASGKIRCIHLVTPDYGRVRLPSLYSDFSLQRYTNPDGFDVNVHSWYDVLREAAWEGLLPPGTLGTDILSLTVGEELLGALETDELGRPQALGAVVVGQQARSFGFVSRHNDEST